MHAAIPSIEPIARSSRDTMLPNSQARSSGSSPGGRPNETRDGVRFFAGDVIDAYLRRTNIQQGLTVAIWRGRHVAEPTELTDEEAHAYWRELLTVGPVIEQTMRPLKMNYNTLRNSVPHLHTHIVSRYEDDPKPGWPFPFPDPEPPAMPVERLRRDVAALRDAISR
jgi:diadenosine tetraphosphate (Ap4A) HIT family hydrolase